MSVDSVESALRLDSEMSNMNSVCRFKSDRNGFGLDIPNGNRGPGLSVQSGYLSEQ